MSCGGRAASIVIFPYNPGDQSGRLLVYCDDCANRPGVLVKLPVALLDEDANGTLEFLYSRRLTLTGPDVLAEVIDVPPGNWSKTAARAIRESES